MQGHRVGKYPIGWPLVLAVGEAVGSGWLVNPVIGALTVVLTYALGRDLFERRTGVVAGVLALASPFFLIQSSTYMSHAAAAWWTALLLYAFLRADEAREREGLGSGWGLVMGAAAGMLVITRQLTAICVFLAFGIAFLAHSIRNRIRWPALLRAYGPGAALAVGIALLQPLYLTLVTGSPTTNLYTMIWPYDRLGFGPNHGPNPEGHSLGQALFNTRGDLELWASELFGWPYISWVPLFPGLWISTRGARPGRRFWPWLLVGIFVALVIVHMAYWVGASVYGPRYYYEAHAGLSVLAAVGLVGSLDVALRWLRNLVAQEASRDRPLPAWPAGALTAILVVSALLTYLPGRLRDWQDVYGISRAPLDRLAALSGDRPVLVLVRGGLWVDYASFFALNSPWYDGPVVAAHDLNLRSSYTVIALYPDRDVWFYKDGQFSREPFPYEESPP
jgi:4-amino-4-deoxy-L-arabinose transferase-like glycosyltransferase